MATKKQIRERMDEKRAREAEETRLSGLAAQQKDRQIRERKEAQRTIELQQAAETMERRAREARAKEAMSALAKSAENAAYSITTYIGVHAAPSTEEK